MRFTIKDILWLTTLCAVSLGWFFTYHKLEIEKEGRRNDLQIAHEKLRSANLTSTNQQRLGTMGMEQVSDLIKVLSDQQRQLSQLDGIRREYQSYQDQLNDLRSKNDLLNEELAVLKEKYEKE